MRRDSRQNFQTMNGAAWKILAAIFAGSLAGALLRLAAQALLTSSAWWPIMAFGFSAVVGLALGFLMGWLAMSPVVRLAWGAPAVAATVAALGTIAAAAVVGMEGAGDGQLDRPLFVAASHIATVILTATIGLALVRWRIGR